MMKYFKTRVSGCMIRVVGDEVYVQNFGWEVPWHMSTCACLDVEMGGKVPKRKGEWN